MDKHAQSLQPHTGAGALGHSKAMQQPLTCVHMSNQQQQQQQLRLGSFPTISRPNLPTTNLSATTTPLLPIITSIT